MIQQILLWLLVVGVKSKLFEGPPRLGPYLVARKNYRVNTLDPSDPSVDVVFPKWQDDQYFPLLVFMHGLYGGGIKLLFQKLIIESVASFGFIIVAPRSCDLDCEKYYAEALKAITWAQKMKEDPVLGQVNHTLGYGIYGHSMGGRATAEALPFAQEYNIQAGLILHPAALADGKDLDIRAPLAAFTGTEDYCCGEETTRFYYEPATSPKAYANMKGALHGEPILRLRWTPYVASWFKIFLQNDTGYYYDSVYGSNPDSLCGGSIPMKNDCEALP